MINPGFNFNKTFRGQVENYMFTTSGAITQPFIKATLLKKRMVLALILFYETR